MQPNSVKYANLLVTFYYKKSVKFVIKVNKSIFRNKVGTQLEKIKTKLQRLFKERGLEIPAESN